MTDDIEHDLDLIEQTAIEALDGTTEVGPALQAIADRVDTIRGKLDDE